LKLSLLAMSVYFLAHIDIHDPEEYQKYLDGAGEVFARYNGKYLAVDQDPEIVEGDWEHGRIILIRFESREDFDAWYRSGEYQEILKYRLSASKSNSLLIQGKD
jgi:uncharacterized protein (DUF1330 family)